MVSLDHGRFQLSGDLLQTRFQLREHVIQLRKDFLAGELFERLRRYEHAIDGNLPLQGFQTLPEGSEAIRNGREQFLFANQKALLSEPLLEACDRSGCHLMLEDFEMREAGLELLRPTDSGDGTRPFGLSGRLLLAASARIADWAALGLSFSQVFGGPGAPGLSSFDVGVRLRSPQRLALGFVLRDVNAPTFAGAV